MDAAMRSAAMDTDLELDDMGRGFTTPLNTDSHASGGRHRSDNESLIDENLTHLARRISSQATSYRDSTPCALNPEPGSHLDPNSHTFKPRAWVREFVRLLESDPKAAEPRALSVAFRRLSVFGWTTGTESQTTTLSILRDIAWYLARRLVRNRQGRKVEILRDFEGVVRKGEMLLVLGPPGSGCSTLLKTLSGQTAGLKLSPDSYINFRGIGLDNIRSSLRGEVLYNAELDTHLAHLTVGETLMFAARARSPRHPPEGFSRQRLDAMTRDVIMATFGLTHTANTLVGDDFVRGISGGERRRVSIAEAALTGAKCQFWDNSTRGLDSINAISFCHHLRVQADLLDVAAVVSLYQAPQAAYDLFDRVTVIYEGRQIYFGRVTEAKSYFEEMGFECPERQIVPDFLTSMTSPHERRVRAGFHNLVPRTPDEFAERWRSSKQRQALIHELEIYEESHPSKERMAQYQKSRRAEQAKSLRPDSPYTISYFQQLFLTLWRAYRRLLADPGFTIASLLFNLIMALLLGSMFYNLRPDSSSFYYRGGVMFFSLLFNAFASQLEVLTIYAERPVVEKQSKQYAFYHQSAQAIASYLIDLPYKIINMFVFNLVIYFMANLKREPGAFFFFCLVTFLITLVQSAIFRILASVTRTSDQAMIPSALLCLGLMIYTGFTTPTRYMPGWSRWMAYINPLAYAFESLMANEFHGQEFPCAELVPLGPEYIGLPSASQICSVVGAEPGSLIVNGDNYINSSFDYWNSHKWRNVGILCAFLAFCVPTYILAAEASKPPSTKGEILVFRRNKGSQMSFQKAKPLDSEDQLPRNPVAAETGDRIGGTAGITAGTACFHWEDICYDIKIKGQERRLLDHVDGWVKPGVSTALMGVSGAGKTTLLDVLAARVTIGVVSGDTMINGRRTDAGASFQHKVGYVQQQDLHLPTMTVAEALEFSALLRQSAEIPRSEKLQYVQHVIDLLEMRDFADAVIGWPGVGLNVEQRKRLTIGVELAARPQLLIFFDEPTSGLDSQTSWTISELLKRLTNSGQAVLCTIHQPSAILFDQFDRLLLIAPGGKTAYFGDLGKEASTLINYFEANGASPCPAGANPAEWMLEVIASPKDDNAGPDWHHIWRNSPEHRAVKEELRRLRALGASTDESAVESREASQHHEFVASSWTQYREVIVRTSKHFWRSPTYIWSKFILITLASLYLGFSFTASNTIQGLQNQLWAIFMLLVIFVNINEQVMPMFVPQRALYEARERPSKMYRWSVYLSANIMVELAWTSFSAILIYLCWYYPMDFVRNTNPDDKSIRSFLVFLFVWAYLLLASTFSYFAISWIALPEVAAVLTSLFWMLCILFCGVGVPRSDLPSFWTFMYRVSPATYLTSGIMSAAVAHAGVTCADNEILRMVPPEEFSSCEEFLAPFVDTAGGLVLNPEARDLCSYCPIASTDEFLARFEISYATRWRDFGVMWAYIVANITLALGLYWVFRVPKGKGVRRA